MKRKIITILCPLVCTFLFFSCATTGTGKKLPKNTMKISDLSLHTVKENQKWSQKKLTNNIKLSNLLVTDRCEIPLLVDHPDMEDPDNYQVFIVLDVNGNEMQFLYDTGASNCISAWALEKIGVDIDQTSNDTMFLHADSVDFSDVKFSNISFAYIPGLTFSSDSIGTETAGIIGIEFFVFVNSLCIDYKNSRLVLNDDPEAYKNIEKLPLQPDKDGIIRKFKISVTVDSIPGVALLDTGATCIYLNKNKFDLPVKEMKWGSITTAYGMETVKEYYTDINNLALGSLSLSVQDVCMWDDYYLSYFPQFKDKEMLLGGKNFFDRCTVWISPFENWVRIKKN